MTVLIWKVKCDGCGRVIDAIKEHYHRIDVEDLDLCDTCYEEH